MTTAVKSLSLILLGLIGLYVYCVNAVIFSVANRERDLTAINDLSSAVAGLEAEYVSLSGRITLGLAYDLGFEETDRVTAFALAAPLVGNNN